jgi:hypothetical protein
LRYHLFSPGREHVQSFKAEDLDHALECIEHPEGDAPVGREAWGARIFHPPVDGEHRLLAYLVPALETGREHYQTRGDRPRTILAMGSSRATRTEHVNIPIADCCNESVAKLMAQAPAFEYEVCWKLYHDALAGQRWSQAGLEGGIVDALEEAGTLLDRPEVAFYLAIVTGSPIPGKETP